MYGCFINYAFLKECLEIVPKEIKQDIDITDSMLFNYANFINSSRFSYVYSYFKKDRYKMHDLILKDSNSFIVECASALHAKNDYKRLLFMYGLITSTTLNEYLDSKLKIIIKDTDNIEDVYNVLDIYYATKDEKNIIKNPLYTYFKNSYVYQDYIDDLIHYPLIRAYNFMGSYGYYKKSYKGFKRYAKYTCHSPWKIPFYKAFDALFNRNQQGKQHMPYQLKKFKNEAESNGRFHDAIDHIWKDAIADAQSKIVVLNSYLFFNDEKEFRRKFNIPETKKI